MRDAEDSDETVHESVPDEALAAALRTDDDIARDVRSALDGDAQIEPFEIDVDVSGGVVTVEGVVDSRDERERVTGTVSRVPGVVAVINRLTVLGTGG